MNGNPNPHLLGSATAGRDVFRFETFGNEGFWTDALKLPQGIVAAKFTPVMALKAGLHVDIDAVPAAMKPILAVELQTDLSAAAAPNLNDVATTVALISANAVMGVVARDSNKDGKIDVAGGDKVGLSCAFCHSISDNSVFSLEKAGSIGRRIDGPANHFLAVGASIALGANSRAYYPLLQLALTANGGKTIGRAPAGLTEKSTEAEVDAYLNNPDFYPAGMFDDAPDGNGVPMHNTPMFRADLAAPWGSEGAISRLDNFSNLVYTALLDPTGLLTPGGRAFLKLRGGAAGEEIANDYAAVLAETGVPSGPFVEAMYLAGNTEDAPINRRVDNVKLLDLNAYMTALPAPAGMMGDATAIAQGRQIFVQQCTTCHNVDQSSFVPPMVLPMKDVWPGYAPVVLAPRDPPQTPIQDSPGLFDDKMVVIDASIRGLARGLALPLLLDLARKPVFLHDNSVPTLDALLNPSRGNLAPHPFYLSSDTERAAMVAFLRSLQVPQTQFDRPQAHLTGVPALSGQLDRSKLTMTSVVQVDLDRNIARVPLFKGTYNGASVWYVRMDVSDQALANQLGLNFSPRLVNADNGCPGCIQTVTSSNPIPGAAAVVFAGTVDFSPMRQLIPGATGFPPLMAQPGSVAGPGYSDLIRVQGSNVVYNAPIVATGEGPFDVSEAHTNTLDRVMAIDIVNMTVDLQFVRAFSHGKDIFYFTFGSTAAISATLERGTFVPALATVAFANDDQNSRGARSSIFTFTNGKLGKNDPNAQGLMHVIVDNPPGNLSLQNPALLDSLRNLGDAHNVLGGFPTLSNQGARELYSPLWDLNIAVWNDDVVARGENFAQTDANTIRQLAARNIVTNPGGAKLGSSNFMVNCPVMGFATTAPTEDQAARPSN